jgi:repressor of nif and glnA expression
MENFFEEIKVKGQDLVDKVKAILHEGNVRRIILKDEKGHTFLEIPLSIAAVGVVAAPLLAGLGAIAALVSNFTLVVERSAEDPEKPENPSAS